ncbi:hypothetical protein CNEO2_40022 [Clostridium neonatale]|nr:hypothetical protein CNEO2_220022 [Clostridium neonatale]CAI3203010.1 hypothetical protein CNEO2_270022 [Clostridium neonatale]CAI3241194.1 hypothetical protein CNEO2_320022 [Clostridium neonatale]CAI3242760.1 hypothetical protein CNEO2_40022 [Clostridium neonatale]CAI3591724.1 hypothetical protein CNEO4_200264 [Clostridium neonatale]
MQDVEFKPGLKKGIYYNLIMYLSNGGEPRSDGVGLSFFISRES